MAETRPEQAGQHTKAAVEAERHQKARQRVAPHGPGPAPQSDVGTRAEVQPKFEAPGLHRVVDMGNSNQSATNPCHRFRYDNSTGFKGSIPSGITLHNYWGRLVEAATDNCGGTGDPVISDEWFSYDARGQTTDYYQSSPNSGGWYHIWQNYAANGTRANIQGYLNNGSLFTHALTYDNSEGEGRPQGLWDGTTSSALWAGTAYNPAGQPNQVGMVGGSTGSNETFSYDAGSGRMTQWNSYNTGANKSQTGTLTWNANGTLQKLVLSDSFNPGNAQTCTYGYDDLARLLSANCSPTWAQTFSYDVFGNIKKSGNVSYNPVYNANNRASTSTYDAVGNTLNDGSTSYTYDSEGRPQTLGSNSIVYDAFNRMVEINNGSSHVQAVYDAQGTQLGQMSGQTLKWYILPLAGGVQAVFGPSGLSYYRHADWLGSARLLLDPNGNIWGGRAYAPFGELYAETGVADRLFTGQMQQLLQGATGNYDFLFRQHSAAQGRWLVPDPAGLAAVDLSNPQTWNRYAYVGNNPLNAIDPLGLSALPTPTQFGCGQDPACWKAFGDSVMQAHQGGVNQGPRGSWDATDSLSYFFTDIKVTTVSDSSGLLGHQYVPPQLDSANDALVPGHWVQSSAPQSQFAFTIQIGFSYNFHFWGAGTGTGFAGLAADSHGHVGTYHGGGAGLSLGTGASAGFQLGLSNGNSICSLGGPFGNFSGTLGWAEQQTISWDRATLREAWYTVVGSVLVWLAELARQRWLQERS